MSTDGCYTLDRLSGSVANIRALLSNEQIEEFIRIMESINFSRPKTDDICRLALSPTRKDRLEQYLKEIGAGAELMAITLSLSIITNDSKKDNLEICWTGSTESSYTRMTWPALSEIILEAQESILIVGYTITTGMQKIMGYLEEKSKENVRLEFMIDRVDEKKDFLQWARSLYTYPEIYTRPENPLDPYSALHVKCVVVDEKVAMFGSANLTYHGMKGNIELGLLVKNESTVKKIVQLLNGLKKELVKINLAYV